jgi:translation initiation factor 2-alpha kinase 4
LAVVDAALKRVPDQLRPAVLDIMSQSKSSPSQKRALLVKKTVPRGVVDELELFADAGMF